MLLPSLFLRDPQNCNTLTIECLCEPDLFEAFVKFIDLEENKFNLENWNKIVSILQIWKINCEIYNNIGLKLPKDIIPRNLKITKLIHQFQVYAPYIKKRKVPALLLGFFMKISNS